MSGVKNARFSTISAHGREIMDSEYMEKGFCTTILNPPYIENALANLFTRMINEDVHPATLHVHSTMTPHVRRILAFSPASDTSPTLIGTLWGASVYAGDKRDPNLAVLLTDL